MERDETDSSIPHRPQHTPLFIAAEKNLETIGYFSPATNALRLMKKKTIEWKVLRENPAGGKEEVEVSVTIDGSAMGLPSSTDLDFYTAYQCILSRYILKHQMVPDPLLFTTQELLQLACESKPGGDQRQAVRTWLSRMQQTVIESKAAVFDADKDQWIVTKDRTTTRSYGDRQQRRSVESPQPKKNKWDLLQVFVQCHQEGDVIKGRQVEANVVYSAPWFRKNLERHWTKPLHAPLYFRLRRPLAKVLFRVGDVLLFRGDGFAHKRYDELCTLLGIPSFSHESRILQQLGPAMEELRSLGVIERWLLRKAAGDPKSAGWVIEWFAGGTWKAIQREIRGPGGLKDCPRLESSAPATLPDVAASSSQLELPLGPEKPAAENTSAGQEAFKSVAHEASPNQVTQLIHLFRKLRGHPTVGRPPAHETEKAEFLLTEYGLEKAKYVVEYACEEIRRTAGRTGWGRFFGSVMSYVGEAMEHFHRKQEEKQVVKAVDTPSPVEILVEKRLAELSTTELEILRKRATQNVDTNPFIPNWLEKYPDADRLREREKYIALEVKTLLKKQVEAEINRA